MKTLKLSYSIISQWQSGKYEEAIATYLGKPLPATPAMELGKLYDEKWNKYILETGELPKELGGGKLDNPRVQVKYSIILPLGDEYQILFRGVPDITEPTIITDNKCGRTEANNYVSKRQLDCYSLFIPLAKTGIYRCYNPYLDTLTIGVKFLNNDTRENAINDIITTGGEILDYLLANKLFIDYKG